MTTSVETDHTGEWWIMMMNTLRTTIHSYRQHFAQEDSHKNILYCKHTYCKHLKGTIWMLNQNSTLYKCWYRYIMNLKCKKSASNFCLNKKKMYLMWQSVSIDDQSAVFSLSHGWQWKTKNKWVLVASCSTTTTNTPTAPKVCYPL